MFGNPSGIREMFACVLRNPGNFAYGIRNPGFWNPEYSFKNWESH